MNLGNSFQDHFIVSHIYLGNWFTGWKTYTVLSSDTQQKTMLPYPLNGVHGWVWLDATRNYLQDNQKDQVKYVTYLYTISSSYIYISIVIIITIICLLAYLYFLLL
jgi:hypothetical protein